MRQTPLVTIIMATYNRASLIKESLVSIIQQSFENWECLIIDDGGTDNTEEIISDFLFNDSRICYLKRSSDYKKGLPGCRNMGLDKARGQYIIFFDDDDIVHPQNLEICTSILNQKKSGDFCRYNKKAFCFGNEIKFDEINDVELVLFSQADIDKMITGEVPFASCSVMWRRECFEKVRFNEELMYAEEWECYSRILTSGTNGMSINETLYFNRKHSGSNTGEFWDNSPIRRSSKIEAIKLVFDNLKYRKLLNDFLVKYFIRLCFSLEETAVLYYIIDNSDLSYTEKLKYKLGTKFYPFLRPFFKFKGKVLRNFRVVVF